MRLPKWLRRSSEPTTDDSPTSEPMSPVELYEASGKSLADAPERTQEILREAERSHRRQREDSPERGNTRFERLPVPQGPLHAYELTTADAALMQMMSGARFGPDARVQLPSGRVVTGDEMARWVER